MNRERGDDWSSARLQPAPPSAEVEELLEKTFVREGQLANVFRVMANHPGLMRRVNALGGEFLRRGVLEPHVREAVILRVAWRTGCAYEFAQHVDMAHDAGLAPHAVAAMGEGRLVDLDADQVLACAVADGLLGDDDVDDRTWLALERRWDVAARVELVLLVGFYRMLAGFLNAARVPRDATLPRHPSVKRPREP